MVDNSQLKSQLRSEAREQRSLYSLIENQIAGQQLKNNLLSNHILSPHRSIGCFLSFDGEISTHAVVEHILAERGVCYLPKLKPNKPNRLWFMPYDLSSRMINNRLGIPEVDLTVNHALAVSKIDLVLLPLVAFDEKGNRLGMGGGFYDATFAHLRDSNNRPSFVGLAFESQKSTNLPRDHWDLPLDGVCTEQAFYQFTTSR